MVKMRWMMTAVMVPVMAVGQSAPPKLTAAERVEARAILKQLIETNTTDSVGSTTVAAEEMATRLVEAGYPAADVKVLGPNGRRGNMVIRIHGKANSGLKPILIIGHLDVVEARREDWTTDPFVLVEKGGYFYGRGTEDMKSEDAAVVEDLIRLRREGWVPKRDVIVALTADEEGGGSNGVDWLLKNHRDMVEAEFAMNPDSGGVIANKGVPVQMAVGATEKLYEDFELAAVNAGGHSSRPVPDNAIYHVADALGRIQQFTFPFELNAVTRAYFEKMAGLVTPDVGAAMRGILKSPADESSIAKLSTDSWYNAVMHTTCVATMMTAGHAANALPQRASANVNCRILPGHTADEVRAVLVKVVDDPKVTITAVNNGRVLTEAETTKASLPPPPLNAALFGADGHGGALGEAVQTMWPGLPIVPQMSAGASDSKYTNAAGIPSYGIGGEAVDLDDDREHGKDERLRVESYYGGVEFYYLLLKDLTE